MTALEVLPGLDIAEVAGTSQWRLERLQVANWGGFEGVETLEVDRESTLLSGQSGTGKSTLLDAYLALMMPGTTAFNGASNDTGGGRARGEEQRSLLSYLRGQIDTTTDDSHLSKAKVLRGNKQPTWGGIIGRFIDDGGRRFSAARLYYVPASAMSDGAIVKRLVTMERVLDLTALEAFADGRFSSKDLKAAFPTLEVHESYGGFAEKVCKRLGIGNGGDGRTALGLLARIQAGRQIRTVDDLYKSMVLEEPSTFTAADLALAHFDELDDTYQKMITEQDKAQRLRPLAGHNEHLLAAQSTLEQVSAMGLDALGLSPLIVWETAQEATMVATAEVSTGKLAADTAKELRAAQRQVESAAVEQRAALTAYNAGGGERVAQLEQEILAAEQGRTRREGRLALLEVKAAPLRADFGALDADGYRELVAAGEDFLEEFPAKESALDMRLGPLAGAVVNAKALAKGLEADIEDARQRPGRVPAWLDRQRMEVCEATGMTREELPFIAELLDVPASQERWRIAIEVSLSGSTRRMVVPQERIREVSAAVERMQWGYRMGFDAVQVDLPWAATPDPASVAGKLEVAEGMFAGWVSQHVSAPRRNAVCVETAEELQGPGMRVSIAGQTRSGDSYAHGRNANERSIIGFDNAGAVADLEFELDGARDDVTAAQLAYGEAEKERASLRQLSVAYGAVVGEPFEDIDVRGSDELVSSLRKDRNALLTADDTLAALLAQLHASERVLGEHTKVAGALETQHRTFEAAWTKLISRADQLVTEQMGHEEIGEINAESLARLEGWWTEATSAESRWNLQEWPENRNLLRDKLKSEQSGANEAFEAAVAAIEEILVAYQREYYDPNMSSKVDGLSDFLEIYDEIQATGLAARSQEWRDRLLRWSGEDLVPLTQSMSDAVEDIRSRLSPINHILRKLPFGALNLRLKIDLRTVPDPEVLDFRRRLVGLSSGATGELDPEQMRARFEELKLFMALVRSKDDPRVDLNVADRDRKSVV